MTKEYAKKTLARQNPTFKAREKEQQCAYKQEARKKPGVLVKECAVKKDTIPLLKQVKKNTSVLQSRKREKINAFRLSEKQHQRASQQEVRKK